MTTRAVGPWNARPDGVRGSFELRQNIETPFEINISDSKGRRTYFWNRRPELLATLENTDLSPLESASLLYADWYDSPYIERAMRYARQLGVPVFLNIEHGHEDAEALKSLIPYATICQAVTDASQLGQDAMGVARLLTESGVSTALVTLAPKGAVGIEDGAAIHVEAPVLDVADTCGAGATFSAASLKCSVIGPGQVPACGVKDRHPVDVVQVAADCVSGTSGRAARFAIAPGFR